MFLNNHHISGTIQTDITGTNKPISLAQFDPIYPADKIALNNTYNFSVPKVGSLLRNIQFISNNDKHCLIQLNKVVKA